MESTASKREIKQKSHCVCITDFFTKVKKEFTWDKGIRLFLIFLGSIFMILNSVMGIAIPSTSVACINDKALSLASPLNYFFRAHNVIKYIITIISSLSIDIVIIYALIHWFLCGKKGNYIVSLVIYLIAYLIIKQLFLVREPDGYIWEFPYFPSVFVSYKRTSSLFYSNGLGVLMITCLEFKENEKKIMFRIATALLVFESLFMIVLQAHYIIDIFTAIFMGHYIYIIVKYSYEIFDKKDKKDNREVKNEDLIPPSSSIN